MIYDKAYARAIMAGDFREHLFAHTMRRTKLTPEEILKNVIDEVEEEYRCLKYDLGVSDLNYSDILWSMRQVLNDRPGDATFDYCDARGDDQLCYDGFEDVEPYISLLFYYITGKISCECA